MTQPQLHSCQNLNHICTGQKPRNLSSNLRFWFRQYNLFVEMSMWANAWASWLNNLENKRKGMNPWFINNKDVEKDQIFYLSFSSGWPRVTITLKWTLQFIFYEFEFLFSWSLFTWDISAFITTWFPSQPFTWRAANLPWDTCPILALLVVTE